MSEGFSCERRVSGQSQFKLMSPNRILLCTAILTVSRLAAFAQEPQPSVPGPGRPRSAQPARPEQSPELKHFDLDFSGGTPGALAASISKAAGIHLNLIIPVDYADTQIMPVKVEGVTVPELFSAIQRASQRQVPVVTSQSGRLGGGQKSIEYKVVGVNFQTSPQITDESVWAFTTTGTTKAEDEILGAANAVQPVCKYFQLAPYLLDHTVEDITTAIQTGWKLLKVDPMPQLSFHEETKLLIAVGAEPYIEQIPRVLEQLMFDRESGTMQILKLQFELAEILSSNKNPDSEQKAQHIRDQIEKLAIKLLLKARTN
jgi:hypothetical protein